MIGSLVSGVVSGILKPIVGAISNWIERREQRADHIEMGQLRQKTETMEHAQQVQQTMDIASANVARSVRAHSRLRALTTRRPGGRPG